MGFLIERSSLLVGSSGSSVVGGSGLLLVAPRTEGTRLWRWDVEAKRDVSVVELEEEPVKKRMKMKKI